MILLHGFDDVFETPPNALPSLLVGPNDSVGFGEALLDAPPQRFAVDHEAVHVEDNGIG